MNITFLGGANVVGASCALIEIEGQRILVDAGIRQNVKPDKQLPDLDKVGTPDAFLLTHAHTDHTGALPELVARWSGVKGYCTSATKVITRVLLQDSRKRADRDAKEGRDCLFPLEAIDAALHYLDRMEEVQWRKSVPICASVRATWIPAGHILGAAMIFIEGERENILITGDVSVTDQKTIPGVSLSDLDLPKFVDVMVMESTYGNRQHEDRTEEERRLVSDVTKVIEAGGKVLIPTFAIGRSQEVILILEEALQHGRNFPVYVDGMVRDINRVYSDFSSELSPHLQRIAALRDYLFYSGDITEVSSQDVRDNILTGPGCCIVASSGMLIGGRSSYYAKHFAPVSENLIAITGYQAEGTPGRALEDLAKLELSTERVWTLNNGTSVPVKCQVPERYSLSAHADRDELTRLVVEVQPRTLFLVHGDNDARGGLSKSVLEASPDVEVLLPENGRTYAVIGIRKYRSEITEESFHPAETIAYLRPSVEKYQRDGNTDAFRATVQRLAEAQEYNKLMSHIYLLSSEVLRLRREYNYAIEYITKALELNPDNAEAYTLRGQVHLENSDYDQAIADCNKAIGLSPNDTNAYFYRAIAYESKSDDSRAHADFDRVIEDCTKAIHLNPNDVNAYWGRGYAYLSKGDNDQAIADFTKVMTLDPVHIQAYFQRSTAYRRQGDNYRADADFTKSIELIFTNWTKQ